MLFWATMTFILWANETFIHLHEPFSLVPKQLCDTSCKHKTIYLAHNTCAPTHSSSSAAHEEYKPEPAHTTPETSAVME